MLIFVTLAADVQSIKLKLLGCIAKLHASYKKTKARIVIAKVNPTFKESAISSEYYITFHGLHSNVKSEAISVIMLLCRLRKGEKKW